LRFIEIPSVRTEAPRIRKAQAIGSLGERSGAAGRNPAMPAMGLTGEEVERGLGITRTRFMCLFATGRQLEGATGGAGRLAPLELRLRRDCGSA
jgi:hypothetical protein